MYRGRYWQPPFAASGHASVQNLSSPTLTRSLVTKTMEADVVRRSRMALMKANVVMAMMETNVAMMETNVVMMETNVAMMGTSVAMMDTNVVGHDGDQCGQGVL